MAKVARQMLERAIGGCVEKGTSAFMCLLALIILFGSPPYGVFAPSKEEREGGNPIIYHQLLYSFIGKGRIFQSRLYLDFDTRSHQDLAIWQCRDSV